EPSFADPRNRVARWPAVTAAARARARRYDASIGDSSRISLATKAASAGHGRCARRPGMTLKITPASDHDTAMVVLRLEGRILADTARELRAVCRRALDDALPVLLHLGGVTFADADVVEVLQELERAGCVLSGCSAFLATLLR